MHRVFKPEEAPKDYNFEEICPHCDTPLPVVIDEDEEVEYEVTCPVCGNRIMLCTLCTWDGMPKECDWTKEDGCFRKRKEADDGQETGD